MPTLAQLQTFLASYRAGSLTAAAQELHLSQPAVSKHLRAYDEDLPLLRPYWQTAFEATIENSAAVTVADLRAVCASVAAGAGISVVPRYLAARAQLTATAVAWERPDMVPA